MLRGGRRIAVLRRKRWTPAALGSALVGWWDASDPSTLTLSGGNAASWASKANGIVAQNASSSQQPTYGPTASGLGKPALIFGGDDMLYLSANTGFPMGSAAGDIALVGAITASPGSSPFMFGYGAFSSAGDRFIYGDGTTSTVAAGTYGAGAVSGIGGATDHIVIGTFASTSIGVRVDGGALTSTAASLSTTADLGIIGNSPVANFLTGRISEIAVLNRTLSTDERQRLEGYLAWKWGLQGALAAGHPYKSARP